MKVPTREEVAAARERDFPNYSDAIVHDLIVAAIFSVLREERSRELLDVHLWAAAEERAFEDLPDPPGRSS